MWLVAAVQVLLGPVALGSGLRGGAGVPSVPFCSAPPPHLERHGGEGQRQAVVPGTWGPREALTQVATAELLSREGGRIPWSPGQLWHPGSQAGPHHLSRGDCWGEALRHSLLTLPH